MSIYVIEVAFSSNIKSGTFFHFTMENIFYCLIFTLLIIRSAVRARPGEPYK